MKLNILSAFLIFLIVSCSSPSKKSKESNSSDLTIHKLELPPPPPSDFEMRLSEDKDQIVNTEEYAAINESKYLDVTKTLFLPSQLM